MHIFTLTVAAMLLGQTPAEPTPADPGKPPAFSITGGSITAPTLKDGKLTGGSITAPAINVPALNTGDAEDSAPAALTPTQLNPAASPLHQDDQVRPAQATAPAAGPSFSPSAFTPSKGFSAGDTGGAKTGAISGGDFNAAAGASSRRSPAARPGSRFQPATAAPRIGAPVVQPAHQPAAHQPAVSGLPSRTPASHATLPQAPAASFPKTGVPTAAVPTPVHAPAAATVTEPGRMPAYSPAPRTSSPLQPVTVSASSDSTRSPSREGEVRIGGPRTQVLAGDSPTEVDVAEETATSLLLRDAVVNAKVLSNPEPVSLLDAISRGAGRQQQQKTVKAYWTLSLALADYYFAATESDALAKLHASAGATGARLQAAQAAAYARAVEARLAMTAAQHDFAAAASLPAEDPQYLTVDLPFTGGYRTNFASLFAGRQAPVVMRRLNRMLPVFGELIEARTESAEAASHSFQQQHQEFAAGRGQVESLLASHAHLRKQRMQLLKDIGNYNNSIATYALAVGGDGLPHEKVTAMLIEHPRRVLRIPASVNSSQVMPVSGQQPVRVGTRQFLQPTGVPTLAPLPR